MAGVRGPLFGLDASGSVGDAITFSKWKGRAYVRIKATPSNPRSAGQISTRAMMRFLSRWWGLFVQGNYEANWEELAAASNYSPFNAFVKYNMDRWTQFQTPIAYPTAAAGTVPVLGALTATGGVRQASISQVITTANDGQGLIVCGSMTTGFTPGKTNVLYIAQWSATPVTAVITPLIPGTWYFRTAGFEDGGTVSAFVAQQSATVTG